MNVRVPYSWLQEYLRKKIPAEKAAVLLTTHSASVERVYQAGEELPVSETKIKVPTGEVVFEIETTTNRPDLLSVQGLARELAASTGISLRFPRMHPQKQKRGQTPLAIKIEAQKLCSRYVGVRIEGVKITLSPPWLTQRLQLAGIRPINNIVDITNYVMLEMGQPFHAFDESRVGNKIIVRQARRGEKIKALDGQTYELESDMLVIADKKHPIAIAGVMGGEASGVTNQTTAIILESANFDPVSIRQTSRALNLRSESSARFERGLSDESPLPAVQRAVALIEELSGAQVVTGPIEARTSQYRTKKVTLTQDLLDTYLGEHLPLTEATRSLTKLGFIALKKNKDRIVFSVPYWRDHDVSVEVDLIEEVVRMRGYESVKSQTLPGHYPQKEAMTFTRERVARGVLVGAGFFETITTALVPEKLLEKCGCRSKSLKLTNPLSEELAVLTPTLVPGAIETVARNEREHAQGQIFELQRVYRPRGGGEELPHSPMRLVMAAWGKSTNCQLYRSLKGTLELLARWLGLDVSYEPETDWTIAHPGRSSRLRLGDRLIGHLAEVHPDVKEKFGIRVDVAMVSLDFDKFTSPAKLIPTYIPPPKFPAVKRDLAIVVDESVHYADLVASLRTSALVSHVELFDVYRGKGMALGKKSLAIHLTFSDPDRTLVVSEVEQALQQITTELTRQFGVVIR